MVARGADGMTGLAAIVAFVAVVALVPLAILALRIAAGFFLSPVPPPPGLARVAAIVAQHAEERQARIAARQRREPAPAELVLTLRAITGTGRR